MDISPYSVYGFTGITVPEGEPAAWRDALMACLCSFSFKPEYVYDAVDISNAEKEMLLAWGEQMAVMHEAMVKTWVGY